MATAIAIVVSLLALLNMVIIMEGYQISPLSNVNEICKFDVLSITNILASYIAILIPIGRILYFPEGSVFITYIHWTRLINKYRLLAQKQHSVSHMPACSLCC